MTAGILGPWWFWRGERKGVHTLQYGLCLWQQVQCIPNFSADPQQQQELCNLRRRRWKHPHFYPNTALLLSFPPQSELPPPFPGSFRGSQTCTLFLSSISRKNTVNNISHQWRSFS